MAGPDDTGVGVRLMGFGGRFGIVTVASMLMLAALPAAAQDQSRCATGHDGIAEGAFSGFPSSALMPPCAEPTLPPNTVRPLFTKKPSEFAEPPGEPLIADQHVASTDLGFQQGVAPAPGRSITFGGQKYRVVDVRVAGGGPTFAGGSPFVIGVSGSVLQVGLKAIVPGSLLDPDRLEVTVVN
jgi:hypothetical protein